MCKAVVYFGFRSKLIKVYLLGAALLVMNFTGCLGGKDSVIALKRNVKFIYDGDKVSPPSYGEKFFGNISRLIPVLAEACRGMVLCRLLRMCLCQSDLHLNGAGVFGGFWG